VPLEERLELDISEALRGIDTIEDALAGSAQAFKVALAEALDLLSSVAMPEVDAAGITSSLSEAVAAADLTPEIEADASTVAATIDEAVNEANLSPSFGADASEVTDAIDQAVEAADATPEIEADASSVTSTIDAAIDAARTDVALEGDASAVGEALEDAIARADREARLDADASAVEDELGRAVDAVSGEPIRLDADARPVTQSIEDAVSEAETEVGVTADADPVTDAIEQAVADAASEVELSAEAGAVTTAIEDALTEAETEAAITADASEVTASIDEALAAAITEVILTGDASAIPDEIAAALESADEEFVINAITDGITAAIEEAVTAADSEIDLTANTDEAEEALADLGSAGTAAEEGLSGSSDALGALQGSAALATGDLAGVGATLGAVSARGSAVAGVGLALAGAFGAMTSAALESETVQRRFNTVLGDFATRVDALSIPGFAEDLEELAERTGNSDEAMRAAAARVFDFGRSAGVAAPQVAETTEQILLLATRATTLNPALGDAGAVADRLAGALARGGRTLIDFGIALTPAQIQAEALRQNIGKTADELTVYELAAAGASLATSNLGERLKTDITDNADQPAIALRRLREEFGNALEAFGQPLIEPLIEAVRNGQPILLEFGEVFAELARSLLPLVASSLGAIAPAVSTVADVVQVLLRALGPVFSVLEAIPDPLLAGVAAFAAFNAILGPVGSAISGLIGRLALAAGPAGFAGLISPVGLAAAALGTAIGVMALSNDRQAEAKARVDDLTASYQDQTKAITESNLAQAEKIITENDQVQSLRDLGLSVREFSDLTTGGRAGFESFVDELVRAGDIAPEVGEAVKRTGGNMDEAGDAFFRAGGSVDDLEESNLGLVGSFVALANEAQATSRAELDRLVVTEQLSEAQRRTALDTTRNADGTLNYVGALERVRPTSEDAARGTDGFAAALEEEKLSAEETEDALQGLLDATIGFVNSSIGADNAAHTFAESLSEVQEKYAELVGATREHGRSSDEAKEAQDALNEAVRGARDDAQGLAEAQVRLASDRATAAGTTLSAAEAERIYLESLRNSAGQATGPTKQAVLDLIGTYNSIPTERKTALRADASQAIAEVQRFGREVGALEKLGLGLGGRLQPRFSPPGAMAGGTFGPGFVEVGEAGRELVFVNPGTSATVIPNRATEEILSGRRPALGAEVAAAIDRLSSQPRVLAQITPVARSADVAYELATETARQLNSLSVRLDALGQG
jgi:hypothetical protein